MKILKLSLLLLLFPILAFAQNQPDTVNLSSPYHTIRTYLIFLETGKSYQPEKSAAAFSKNIENAQQYAIKLKQIFDGKGLVIPLSQLPRNENFRDSTANENIYVLFPKLLPEIYLEKKGNEWVYSDETVTAIASNCTARFTPSVQIF